MITIVITIFLGRLTCNCMSVFFLSLSATLIHLTFLSPRLSEKRPASCVVESKHEKTFASLPAVNKRAIVQNITVTQAICGSFLPFPPAFHRA